MAFDPSTYATGVSLITRIRTADGREHVNSENARIHARHLFLAGEIDRRFGGHTGHRVGKEMTQLEVDKLAAYDLICQRPEDCLPIMEELARKASKGC